MSVVDNNGQDGLAVVDHRSLSARKKRDAMRTRILQATMAVFAERTNLAVTIEDVITAADISRGTFYKYFTSIDGALIASGRHITDQMTLEIRPVYDVLTDPVQRISTGMRLFLTRALSDSRWAGFVVRAELVPNESVLLDYVYADLRTGASLSVLQFKELQAAADSVLGATVEGMRTMMLGRTKDADKYIDEVIRLTLLGLGVSRPDADAANVFARNYIVEKTNWA